MQLGRFTIEQLNEGRFSLSPDGKINRAPVTEAAEHAFSAAEQSLVGINPLYITDDVHHLLVDTGLGWGLDHGSENSQVSNIATNLKIFDVRPADITHVILTHLHYDHVAGLSFTDQNIQTLSTFPNAKIIVQKTEWDFAVQQVQHQSIHAAFYRLDDLYRLYANDAFSFLESGRLEIIPGVEVIKTGGHTPGHQVVKISDSGKYAYFMGDLLPAPEQLNYFDIANRSVNRILAKNMKVKLLREAFHENAYLFFYHSVHSRVGQLQKDDERKYVLKEI